MCMMYAAAGPPDYAIHLSFGFERPRRQADSKRDICRFRRHSLRHELRSNKIPIVD